jgi:hypothetical protein
MGLNQTVVNKMVCGKLVRCTKEFQSLKGGKYRLGIIDNKLTIMIGTNPIPLGKVNGTLRKKDEITYFLSDNKQLTFTY